MRASNAHISGIFIKSVDNIEVSNLVKEERWHGDDRAVNSWHEAFIACAGQIVCV